VVPDHVHLFVRVGPAEAPASVVRAFKGRTARVLRQALPYLRNHAKALWSPSYFAASVG
jgi:putative transposase